MNLQNVLYPAAVCSFAAATTLALGSILGPIGADAAAARGLGLLATTELQTMGPDETPSGHNPGLGLQAGIRMTCGRGGKCS